MKYERISGILGKAAVVIALGVGAHAQLVAKKGQPLSRASLENDMRGQERELVLSFKMRPRQGTNPMAIIPLPYEMIRTIELANGTPGEVAVIQLDTRRPEIRRAGVRGTRVIGVFDEDGLFTVELPEDLDAHGLFVTGTDGRQVARILNFELVLKSAGGAAVPDRKRPEMDLASPEQEAEAGGLFQDEGGRQVAHILNFELVKKSAGGAAVPDRMRPEMDLASPEQEAGAGGLFQDEGGRQVAHILNFELVKKSAGGAAVPDRMRPEMDLASPEQEAGAGGLFQDEGGRQVAHILGHELVKKSAGGAATAQRPVLDALDLEQESETAYAHWVTYWTDLQIRSRDRVSSVSR